MLQCKDCGAEIPPKEPGVKGRQRVFCKPECRVRYYNNRNSRGPEYIPSKPVTADEKKTDVYKLLRKLSLYAENEGHEVTKFEFADGLGRLLIRTRDKHAIIVSLTSAKVFK